MNVGARGCTFSSCQPGHLGALFTNCYQDLPALSSFLLRMTDVSPSFVEALATLAYPASCTLSREEGRADAGVGVSVQSMGPCGCSPLLHPSCRTVGADSAPADPHIWAVAPHKLIVTMAYASIYLSSTCCVSVRVLGKGHRACSSLATGMVLQNCRVVKQTGKKRGVVVLL